VSESNKRHCAGSVQSHGVVIRYVKQMCLETGPEDSHRRCGGDVFRQTVPDTSSGDRKSSVADGRQSGAADDQ